MPYTAHIAIAAAAARKRQEEEEEDMAGYNKEDLEGWEFKIMRSATGRFKDYQRVQEVCQEEAKAGWEMVEKFDNCRIRFKRRVERRSSDSQIGIDPYRTNVGMGEGTIAVVVIGVVLGLIAAGLLVSLLVEKGKLQTGELGVVLPFVIIVLAAIAIVVARLRHR
jgi:hypothetical protein